MCHTVKGSWGGGGWLSEQAAQMMCVRDVVKTLRTISQQAYLASIAMITTGHVCVCAHTLEYPAVSKRKTL